MRLVFTLLALCYLAQPALAQDLRQPDPSIAPEGVVEIQLQSLQRNDVPSPDAGIAQTWAFAHPNNKRVTGPLERFARMLKGPQYRMLLGHREHTIKPLAETDDEAIFAVTIIPAAGDPVSYIWTLSKLRSGALAGSWLTTNVSPPLSAGKAI